ncbi:UDP-3-O-(3-hydroxymyristoyl)glucosamine N-acyltransferase [Leptospira kanakyensis]|uniref:UDP-3-O-(3-hydroxymyristoyl)glucosamine N-acyltransferase n=1 Tax=Leptospira kanakyensis TaxID=2484968 RepID=A0A6N4QA12_9LEPT|nr:UDP-3-O-(3-hydroxymyristoyl)glucosamine N-acyltransferase [Leptospira kanakyensis]MCW7482600.1 UDP-3-O-(3-hydroxymyristoyl)glucosamine N-acyltransferase [Leptospira kanakyensis]TGK55305.1 UDP-3-O-(3-hydroxymyristoyl)glucosamine N-acyltransferase [Leptospira kanakyensis]TGK60839.1 UDP-3-O-(3-hydroxymyristoyl)glucosamine N-acyltransferase [Leptospira kanakyensis]TGK76686.1 UDP-3-O-(3-hydroxymyristoyl)glucosamine N-acyltransferase [Leptospira kanakyensis]
MKLKDLAERLGASFTGSGDLEISGIKDLEHHTPVDPSSIYYVASKKYLAKHKKSADVKIALTIDSLASSFPNAIIVPEEGSKVKFIQVISLFEKKPKSEVSISTKASVHPTAKLGKDVTIMDFVVIQENVVIGDRAVIHPNVVLEPNVEVGEETVIKSGVVVYYNCKLGKRNLIHSNTVIGADGFGFYDYAGVRYKVPQIGNVIIGDDVEMGAHCTVDRAALESTTIGNFTKFDDHVHVGHNCRVGNYVYIAGATVLAGSVTIEDGCFLAGQSAVAEHLTMKKGSILLGLSGLAEDSKEKTVYFGIPARPALEMHRINSSLPFLPDVVKGFSKQKKEGS